MIIHLVKDKLSVDWTEWEATDEKGKYLGSYKTLAQVRCHYGRGIYKTIIHRGAHADTTVIPLDVLPYVDLTERYSVCWFQY